MPTSNTIMIGLMNELNANIRQGLESSESDFYAESQDMNENSILLFKSWEQYQDMVEKLDEDGTPYLLSVVVGRQKTAAEKRAEQVLEKAARQRELKNAAQNKRRAKQRVVEAEAKKEVEKEVVVYKELEVKPSVKKTLKKKAAKLPHLSKDLTQHTLEEIEVITEPSQ
jgi:hypothetical protein